MILYVKSDIEPVFKNWLWFENDSENAKPISFRGVTKSIDLFSSSQEAEKKLKFKFVRCNSGLLIDFDDSINNYNEYALYIGSQFYCGFKIKERKFETNFVFEHACNYFVIRYAVQNRFLRYHAKGFTTTKADTVFIGLANVNTNSFLAQPIKTNLSRNKRSRYFFALLNNENWREQALQPTQAVKIKNDFKEIPFEKVVIFSYFAVDVTINSEFKNKGHKLTLQR